MKYFVPMNTNRKIFVLGTDYTSVKKVKDQFEKPDFRYDPENLLKFDWKVSKGTIYTGNCCKQCYQSVERLPEF